MKNLKLTYMLMQKSQFTDLLKSAISHYPIGSGTKGSES